MRVRFQSDADKTVISIAYELCASMREGEQLVNVPIAVIGGSGFVGREVIRRLTAQGRSCVNIDLVEAPGQGAEWRQADICDEAGLAWALRGCGSAIFLAAEWRDDVRDTQRYYDVNVGGTASFIAAARAAGIKHCVFTSTVSVYGFTPYEVPEDYPTKPINHYGKSKLQAEGLLREWAGKDSGIALTIARPTVIFGPGNRGNVWNLLNQMANGPFVMIGNGENRKSIAYVENIASFLISRLGDGPGVRTFNYADKPDFSMNELVTLVAEAMDRPTKFSVRIPRGMALLGGRGFDLLSRVLRRPYGITTERVLKFCANTQYGADAVRVTGFVPPVPLRQALLHTIDVEFGRQ